MRFAIIENGTVTNIIKLASADEVTNFPTLNLIHDTTGEVAIGDSHDGTSFVSSVVLPTAQELLGAVLISGVSEIDMAAEEARGRYITTTPTQQTIYDFKLKEAEAYVAAGYPTTAAKKAAYPMLLGESTISGDTIKVLADKVIATKNAWMGIAGAIEGTKVQGKAALKIATDEILARKAVDDTIAALKVL